MTLSARSALGLLLACLALVAAGYAEVVTAPFVADDYTLLCGLGDGSTGLAAVGMRRQTPFLRPLLGLTFLGDWHAFGASAPAMHVHGLVLHALCAWLLGLVGVAWSGAAMVGVVAALAFACFPLHPEAVTWISARGYPLAGCFTLLALAMLLRAPPRLRPATLALAAGACGAAALLAVEPALPIAVYPLALLWGMRAPAPLLRRGVHATVVLAAVTIAYLVLRIVWLGGLGGYRDGEGTSRHTAFALSRTLAYCVQAGAHLIAPGPWDGADGRGVSVAVAFAAVLAGALHLAALHGGAGARRALGLIVAIVAALSVTATWATLGADLAGTRYLYFASMFWCLGLGWSAAVALRASQLRRGIAVAAVVGLLATQLVLVRTVNARWRDSGDLAHRAVEGVVARVRERAARHVFLLDPPATVRGAHALPWGIEAALRLRVGPELRVDVLRDAQAFATVQRTHATADAAARAGIEVGAWDAAQERWRWQ